MKNMYAIIIDEPFKLYMEVVGTEELLPSIKIGVTVEIRHFTGLFLYKGNDVWFECTKWDEFVKKLNKTGIQDEDAVLVDMSDGFMFSIACSTQGAKELRLTCREPIIANNNSFALISYGGQLDWDMLAKIQKSFNDFPKWW